jgi:TM2 domain-containing membrane protein YozV
MSTIFCPQCGTKCTNNMSFCSACGAQLIQKVPNQNGQFQTQAFQVNQAPPMNQAPPSQMYIQNQQTIQKPTKDKIVAGILAILLGDIGVHKFYLGKIGQGLFYLCFCWTGIPAIIGLIEGILYLTASDQEFQAKYVGP